MLLFENIGRKALILLSLTGVLAVSGCTLEPVYGNHGAIQQSTRINLAEPKSRLEQIIYQDLARRFGTSDAPDAPVVKISLSNGSRSLAQSKTQDPAVPYLDTIRAHIDITQSGQPLVRATRTAASSYTTDEQVLANNAAKRDAEERAAHALAEQFRFVIIEALAEPPSRK